MTDMNEPSLAYRIFSVPIAILQFGVLFIGGVEAAEWIGIPGRWQTGASGCFALLCLLWPHYPMLAAAGNSKRDS
jgi:hypothetical protein